MPDISIAVRRRIEKIDILLWLYGNACFWCSAEMIFKPKRIQGQRTGKLPDLCITIDELRPRAKGGRRVLSNQVLACHQRNNRRGSCMAPTEAIAGHRALLECHDLLRLDRIHPPYRTAPEISYGADKAE